MAIRRVRTKSSTAVRRGRVRQIRGGGNDSVTCVQNERKLNELELHPNGICITNAAKTRSPYLTNGCSATDDNRGGKVSSIRSHNRLQADVEPDKMQAVRARCVATWRSFGESLRSDQENPILHLQTCRVTGSGRNTRKQIEFH